MSKKISILVVPFENEGKVTAYVLGDDGSSYEGVAEYDECYDLDFMVGVNIAMKRALEKYHKGVEAYEDHLKMCEHYFVPDVTSRELYAEAIWFNDFDDKNMKKRGLIYHTKEEAIARAKEMLGIE